MGRAKNIQNLTPQRHIQSGQRALSTDQVDGPTEPVDARFLETGRRAQLLTSSDTDHSARQEPRLRIVVYIARNVFLT